MQSCVERRRAGSMLKGVFVGIAVQLVIGIIVGVNLYQNMV